MNKLIEALKLAIASGEEADMQKAKARLQRYLNKHMMAVCLMTPEHVALCKTNGINF